MGIYSIAQRTITATNATAAWEIINAATEKARILEIGFTQNAATASVFGLGRPAVAGITPTTPLVVLDESDGNAPVGLTTCAVAWATPPTVPANFFRRISTPATIGAGVIWTFPQGLAFPVNGTLVLWNLGGNSVVDAYAVISE